MRKMLACPKCKGIYSAEEGYSLECSECKVPLTPLNVTKDEWKSMSSDQKDKIRTEALKAQTANATTATAEEITLQSFSAPIDMNNSMANDIKTIKNILIFYLVATILGAIIIVVTLAP